MAKFALLSKYADRKTASVARRIRTLLDDEVKTIAVELSRGADIHEILARVSPLTENKMNRFKSGWGLKFAVDGYNFAGGLIGKTAYVESIAKALSDEFELDGDPADFFGADELVANHLKPRIDDYINHTSKLETKASARHYETEIKKALKGWTDPVTGQWRAVTPSELATWFEAKGLAWDRARAELMARTLTNWTYNEGAVTQYENSGITHAQWLVTEDDATCEFCMSMENETLPLREQYAKAGDILSGIDGGEIVMGLDVDHPPLHPHCRCTIVPVID